MCATDFSICSVLNHLADGDLVNLDVYADATRLKGVAVAAFTDDEGRVQLYEDLAAYVP